jgi:hypothetical protein
MPRFHSDMDYRAYFYGEEPPTCTDCDGETMLIDPHDKAPRCAACQEKEMERRDSLEQEEPNTIGHTAHGEGRR